MFDNVNWNDFINEVLSYLKGNWKYLIIKADISKTSYSSKFYYSKDESNYIDLYNELENNAQSDIFDATIPYLESITNKFDSGKERMFLTVKAEKSGNVKVLYRNIKDASKLPFDESINYLRINENDKKW